jgi:hypothetical protein
MLSTYAGVAKGKHCCFMLLLKLQSVPEQTTGLNRIESWRVEQLISDGRQFFARGGEHETKLPFTSDRSVSMEDLFRP